MQPAEQKTSIATGYTDAIPEKHGWPKAATEDGAIKHGTLGGGDGIGDQYLKHKDVGDRIAAGSRFAQWRIRSTRRADGGRRYRSSSHESPPRGPSLRWARCDDVGKLAETHHGLPQTGSSGDGCWRRHGPYGGRRTNSPSPLCDPGSPCDDRGQLAESYPPPPPPPRIALDDCPTPEAEGA